MATWTPDVRPCPPELLETALGVLYQRIPDVLRDRLVHDVVEEARRGQVDLSGLWVAIGPGRRRVAGALLTQDLTGRAAAVWAPEVRPSWRRRATATRLVRAALDDLRARGFRIAQAVLDESATSRGASDLTRGGLPRVTELLYLERDTRVPLEPAIAAAGAGPPPELEWRPFDPDNEDELRRLLRETYRESQDLPELEGVRSLEDILQGHRGAGPFVPERWQLGRLPGQPEAGVALLLSEFPERDVWEVIYLGLTPAARGRGLGRQAIRRALELAAPHVERIELAVDVRNRPATRLYQAAGFVAFDRRAVHLAVFPETGA